MCHTLESITIGDTDDVDHFILGKHSSNWNLFLKIVSGFNFNGTGASIKPDFHNVSHLLPLSEDLHLVGGAVLFLGQILLDLLLAIIVGPLSADSELGENLLL